MGFLEGRVGNVCEHPAWKDSIAPDALLSIVCSSVLCQTNETMLACCVPSPWNNTSLALAVFIMQFVQGKHTSSKAINPRHGTDIDYRALGLLPAEDVVDG